MPELDFEWDPEKARTNEVRHGVLFSEAATVFSDVLAATVPDDRHSTLEEQRFITVGLSDLGRVLYVSYTERLAKIRLISARRATTRERIEYEEGL